MLQQPHPNPKVMYEADPSHMQTVHELREKLHGICNSQLMHKYVRVRTLEGHEYEGIIVFIDGGHLYLSLAEEGAGVHSRLFPYPYTYSLGAGNAILPLVLFNLLTITLLYT